MLWPVLELCIVFPGAFACFLAVWERLRVGKARAVLITVPVLLAVCVLGGALC